MASGVLAGTDLDSYPGALVSGMAHMCSNSSGRSHYLACPHLLTSAFAESGEHIVMRSRSLATNEIRTPDKSVNPRQGRTTGG